MVCLTPLGANLEVCAHGWVALMCESDPQGNASCGSPKIMVVGIPSISELHPAQNIMRISYDVKGGKGYKSHI